MSEITNQINLMKSESLLLIYKFQSYKLIKVDRND